jgi:hypothetical protein
LVDLSAISRLETHNQDEGYAPMARKKRNALKHGANAKEVMLGSERYKDYESLRADLDLEFAPNGSTEEYLVKSLADLRWRRRRLDRYDQIIIQKQLNEIRKENEAIRGVENLVAFASEFKKADSEEKVGAILSRLTPIYLCFLICRWPFEKGADPVTWSSKVGEALARWNPPTRREGADEFVEIFDLDTFDEDLARIERLDAMIDRTIKRLMQIKTMKQMHGRLEPKLINLSAVKNPLAQDGTENHSTG